MQSFTGFVTMEESRSILIYSAKSLGFQLSLETKNVYLTQKGKLLYQAPQVVSWMFLRSILFQNSYLLLFKN
jgi:hypothetical protein